MSVQNFLQELKGPKHRFQLAKSHLFMVTMDFGVPISDSVRMMSMLCHQVVLPGQHLQTQPAYIHGLKYEVPVAVTQDDLMVSFYVDRNYQVPQIFDQHLNRIVNQYKGSSTERGSFLFKYKTDYQIPKISISLLDITNKDSDVRAVYTYENCFVKSSQAMSLDYQNTNIQQYSLIIDFERTYKEFKALKLTPVENKTKSRMDAILKRVTLPVNFETVRAMIPEISNKFNQAKDYLSSANEKGVESTLKSFF
jgi:hypothetical protein